MRHKRKAQRAKPEADHSVLRVLPPSSVPSSDVTQQIIFPPGNALNASPCGNTFSLPNPSRKESIIYIRRSEIQRGGEMSSSFSAPSSLYFTSLYFFLFVSLICLPPVFVFFLLSRLFHSSPPLSAVFLQEGKENSSPAGGRGRGEKPGRPYGSGSHPVINRRKAFRARGRRFPGTWHHIVPRHGRKRKSLLPLRDFFPDGSTILPAGESMLRTR